MTESKTDTQIETLLNGRERFRCRVLHVDDDPAFLKIAKECLEMQGGFQVETAGCVEEAMDKLRKEEYDAIVSDYQMPGKDGLVFLKELREEGNDIPFILLTGKGKEELVVKALNLGADAYFDKHSEPEAVYCELAHGLRSVVEKRKAKIEAVQEGERLRAVLTSSPDAIIISDLNGSIIDCNEAALMLSGYSTKEEIVGKSGFEFIADRDRERASKNLERTLEEGTAKGIEYTLLRKGKEEYLGELSASTLKDASGNLTGFVATIRDITERRQMEKQLKASEEKYRNLVENSKDAIAVVNFEGNVLFANKAAERLTGYTLKEGKGMNIRVITPKRLWPKSVAMLLKARMGKPIPYFEYELKRKDGTTVPVETGGQAVFEDGKPVAIQIITRETTGRRKAEETLRESEEKFKAIFDGASDGILVADPETQRLVFANQRMSELTGYSLKELQELRMQDLHPEKDFLQLIDQFSKQLKGEKVIPRDFPVLRKDKKIICCDIDGRPVDFGQGAYRVGFFRDITERKKTEQMLKESEEKYRNLVELAPDGIATVNAEGIVTSTNRSFLTLLGYDSEEVVGKPFIELKSSRVEDIPRMLELFSSMMKGELPSSVEFLFVRRDGTRRWAEVHPSLLVKDGNPVGAFVIMRDVSERKKAEEERSRLLHDLGERVKELNCFYGMSKLVEKSGASLDDILQGTVDLLPDALQYPDVACARLVVENREFTTERFKETRWKQEADIRVGGRKAGFVEVCYLEEKPTSAEGPFTKEERDLIDALAERLGRIIERYAKELALKESEGKFKSLFEMSPDAIATFTLEGTVTSVNNSFLELAGVESEQDVVGKPFTAIKTVREDDLPRFAEMFKSLISNKTHSPFELSSIRTDGTSLSVDVRLGLLTKGDKTVGLQAILRDVTERKKIEDEMRESEERFRALFMGNPEAAAYLDPDFHVREINPRFEKLFGYSLEDVKGKQINDVVVPADRRKEAESLDKDAVSGYVFRDTVRERKDGSLVAVSVSAAPIRDEGEITGIVAMYHDISDLKTAEKRLDMMNEKLRVVGSLTRHDVRNKLTAVAGNTYLLRKSFAGDPNAMERLNSVETAIRESEKIFGFASVYEKLGVERLVYVDAKRVLDEAVGLFPDLKGVKIVNGCNGLTLLADSLLRQLFYNLIDDSLKYGGKLTRIGIHYEKSEDQLKLVYEDDGVGISPDAKPKLFSEGYTTGKGSGYGLYLIRKMMDAYGWTIEEKGVLGKGVQFVITIPRTNEEGKENYRLS